LIQKLSRGDEHVWRIVDGLYSMFGDFKQKLEMK